MKLLALTLIACLVALSAASPATTSNKNNCKTCEGTDYAPVCGIENKNLITFGSECVLKHYNCNNGHNFSIKSRGECPGKVPVRLS